MLPFSEEIRKLPVLYILLPFCLGIVIQEELRLYLRWEIFSSFFTVLFLFLIFLRVPHFLIVFVFISAFSSGALITRIAQNTDVPGEEFYSADAFVGHIQDLPSIKNGRTHILFKIEKYKTGNEWNNCNFLCKAVINDSTENRFLPELRYLIKSKIKNPDYTVIPGQFDYAQYLYFKGIYAISYIKKDEIVSCGAANAGWLLKINKLRHKILRELNKGDIPKQEKSIISSFILGFRGEIDPDLNKAFAVAGASHILSVSGMHVGIFYILLTSALAFLNRNTRTRLLKSSIIISAIWFYALLAGFSPPVLRSTFMFSFFALSEISSRKITNINILGITALILLSINPFYLFDVGFQLSYAAMLGIFLIYTPIADKRMPKNKVIKYTYCLILLSFAAQVTTLPFIIYYFQKFPSYFLLTNLLIVPLSTLVLYAALLYTLSLPISFLVYITAYPAKYLTMFMNRVIFKVEDLPGNQIRFVEIGVFETLLISAGILLFICIVFRKSYRLIPWVISVIIIFFWTQHAELFNGGNETKIATLKISQIPALVIADGNQRVLLSTPENKEKIQLKNSVFIDVQKKNINFSQDRIQVLSGQNDQIYISTSRIFLIIKKTDGFQFSKILIFNKKYEFLEAIDLAKTKQVFEFL